MPRIPDRHGVPAGAVDWVLIQLRTSIDGPTVLSRSAFLRSDGSIMRDDGTTDDVALEVPDGDYHIVIKHRNHLSVASAAAVTLGSDIPIYSISRKAPASTMNGEGPGSWKPACGACGPGREPGQKTSRHRITRNGTTPQDSGNPAIRKRTSTWTAL